METERDATTAGAVGPVDHAGDGPADRASGQVGAEGAGAAGDRTPSWWHRDHPTFTALSGFFAGLAFVVIVPGLFAATLGWVFESHTAEDLFPFVLVTLALPLVLVLVPRTRRFGRYMLVGIGTTLLVVAGVAAVVLWYMVQYQS